MVYKNKSYSDLVEQIQLISIKGKKFPSHTTRSFNDQFENLNFFQKICFILNFVKLRYPLSSVEGFFSHIYPLHHAPFHLLCRNYEGVLHPSLFPSPLIFQPSGVPRRISFRSYSKLKINFSLKQKMIQLWPRKSCLGHNF